MFKKSFTEFEAMIEALSQSQSLSDALLYQGGPSSFEELLARAFWNYVDQSPQHAVLFHVHSVWTPEVTRRPPSAEMVKRITLTYVTSGGVGLTVKQRSTSGDEVDYTAEVYKDSWKARGYINPYSGFALELYSSGWSLTGDWPTAEAFAAMRAADALANGEPPANYSQCTETVTPAMLAERKRAWEERG